MWAWLGLKLPLGRWPKTELGNGLLFPAYVDSQGSQDFFFPVFSFFPSRLSAALEISFIVRILSLKQHEATVFTGAPG